MKRNIFVNFISKPILWLAPPLFLILIFYAYPLIYSIIMAFSRWYMIGVEDPIFVGLNNFKTIFLNDPRFVVVVRNTFIIILTSVTVQTIFGFFLGILLSINFKGKGFFRLIVMFPIFLMPVAAACIWRSLYNYEDGIINIVLNFFAIPKVEWLTGYPETIFAAIIIDIWQWTPFVALIIAAGIESLPRDTYEAAVIDGASTGKVLRYIAIPLLKNLIIVIIFLRLIELIKFFETIFILTGGGPGYSTETMGIYIFYKGLWEFEVGYAAALSWILVIITIVILIGLTKLLQRREY